MFFLYKFKKVIFYFNDFEKFEDNYFIKLILLKILTFQLLIYFHWQDYFTLIIYLFSNNGITYNTIFYYNCYTIIIST